MSQVIGPVVAGSAFPGQEQSYGTSQPGGCAGAVPEEGPSPAMFRPAQVNAAAANAATPSFIIGPLAGVGPSADCKRGCTWKLGTFLWSQGRSGIALNNRRWRPRTPAQQAPIGRQGSSAH